MQPYFDLVLKIETDHGGSYLEQSVFQLKGLVGLQGHGDDGQCFFVGNVAEL